MRRVLAITCHALVKALCSVALLASLPLLVEATGVKQPLPPATQRPGTVAPPGGIHPSSTPDLVPIADGGKFLTFQNRMEWRYAFWARNNGNATSRVSRIRLKFYHRGSRGYFPWTLHADIHLDIPSLKSGEESRALVARIIYHRRSLGAVPQDHQYKWEFFVDDGNQVAESNEENNVYRHEGYHVKHDVLETGPSGGFH